MKTAFLFPGQGAQHLGMGKDIYDSCPPAAALFDKANDILGFDLKDICFNGPEEKLNSTIVSQPAIFVHSAALLELFRQAEGGAIQSRVFSQQPEVLLLARRWSAFTPSR